MQNLFLILFFGLGLFTVKASALDCFQCFYTYGSSSTDCIGPVSNSALLKSCAVGQDYCSTVSTTGSVGDTVVRGCSFYPAPYTCYTAGVIRSCSSTCKISGCNNEAIETHQQNPSTPGSSSLKCYQCTYSSKSGGTECYGPSINSNYLMNCPDAGQKYCLTITSNSDQSVVENTITRSCSSVLVLSGCATIEGVTSCTSTCNTDGCNNQNTIGVIDSDPEDGPLQCYQCQYFSGSSSDSSCKEKDVDEAHLLACPNNENYCTVMKVSGTVNGQQYEMISRGCSSQPLTSDCSTVSGLKTCYSSCSTDGCNGSDVFKVKIIAIIPLTMISTFLLVM
ncbi:uncharacterized protein LOC143463249 [Clavelina lepadiformis]|uniref:Uncharacterized protein n=1 Tax=Clavelina lepadiformis TaxID=159417 RepID=A0ABP0FNN8_CLALP